MTAVPQPVRQPRSTHYAGRERKKLLQNADERLQNEMARMELRLAGAKAAREGRQQAAAQVEVAVAAAAAAAAGLVLAPEHQAFVLD
eukprot:SAG11_NODE_3794_length_2222_cov_1.245407_1_plen_87_part_00